MTALPLRVLVVRYRCPFCSRSRSKQQATVEHIDRCWSNPDNRACRTCGNYGDDWNPPRDVQSGCGCQDGGGPTCDAGVKLPADGSMVTGCPKWKTREEYDFDEADAAFDAADAERTVR